VFTAPPTAALTSQPRKGIGARVAGGFSRLGAALRSVVARGPRRPQSGPESRTGRESRTVAVADSPPAARQARAPRQPSRARKGGLARLFGRRRALAAVPEPSPELHAFEFTGEAFPELSPEARAFFNTPLEDCDPAMLGVVLEALAGLIAGSMTPQEGMRDVRDVFLALSSRMEAALGEAGDAPPADPPEVAAAPADLASTAAIESAAIEPQAASPDLAGPAPRRDSAAPWSDAADVAQGEAAAISAAPDQPATAPAEPQAEGVSVSFTSLNDARAPNRSRVPPRHARRRFFRGGPGFAGRSLGLPRRNIIFRIRYIIRTLPQPVRLLCYAACAGPPALWRRA
jgi:hypothetical protein